MAAGVCAFTNARKRALSAVYRRTQVQSRGSVLLESPNGCSTHQAFFAPATKAGQRGPTTESRLQRYAADAPSLAIAACVQACERAAVSARSITQLVTVSCTGFMAPGIDIRLIKHLGIDAGVGRTHIGFMGCHGALNGLRVAKALAESSQKERVLLCAVELCSLHFQYGWDDNALIANALFADGAAAAVIALREAPAAKTLMLSASGSSVIPDSEEAMGWRIGDHGFEMRLAASVPGLIRRHLRSWTEQWLGRQGLQLNGMASWAVHPGGPKILDSVASALELPDHALAISREVLAQHGNMSSPTVLFILEKLLRQDAPRPIVAMAFGPGLSIEACLIH